MSHLAYSQTYHEIKQFMQLSTEHLTRSTFIKPGPELGIFGYISQHAYDLVQIAPLLESHPLLQYFPSNIP